MCGPVGRKRVEGDGPAGRGHAGGVFLDYITGDGTFFDNVQWRFSGKNFSSCKHVMGVGGQAMIPMDNLVKALFFHHDELIRKDII